MVHSLHVTKSQHMGAPFCSLDVEIVIHTYLNRHPTDISWLWPVGTRVLLHANTDWVDNMSHDNIIPCCWEPW